MATKEKEHLGQTRAERKGSRAKSGFRADLHALRSPIVVDDLVKIYKRGKVEVVALRGLSCEIHPGITVVMGPSGCGKTTFLNLLGGLDVPNAGKILLEGTDLTKLDEAGLETYRNAHMGFVFQFMNLIPTLSARENVELPMLLRGSLSKVDRRSRAGELLALVNMGDRASHKPDEMSGGEQQRVAIAMALANDPVVLLADEPTGELDSESRHAVLDAFRALADTSPGKAIVIVTHDPATARIADRILQIEDGKIFDVVEGEALHLHRSAHSEGIAHSEEFQKVTRKLERVRKIVSDLAREFDEK